MELKPFEFVESDLTRKYTNLQPTCRKTLMKYMHLTTLEVEKAITKSLPDRFALLLNGWTHHSTHFLAVFASSMENSEPNSVLLSFSPLMDETVLNATEHVTFLETVLEIFDRTPANDEENQTPVIVESDFAEEILQKRQKKGDESKYLNCRFLFPTSNILERFFSAAGYALNNLRQNITPEHLEQQLFLRANKKYWTVKTVNSVLSD